MSPSVAVHVFLLPPIIVDHVPHGSEQVMEETFGPIFPIVRVPDDASR